MFLRRANYTHPEFRVGLRDFQRLAPGIAAWGLMTGVAMVKSGMGLLESLISRPSPYIGSNSCFPDRWSWPRPDLQNPGRIE